MQPETVTIVVSVIGGIATIIGTVVAAIVGRGFGARGKQKGMEALTTEINLHMTRWTGEYRATNREGEEGMYSVTVEFKQYGSHVVGEATGNGRKWLIEGVACYRRLCYVYLDTDIRRVSIGASALRLDQSGDKLEGDWMGWTPDGESLTPQKLTLNIVPDAR